MSWRTSNFGIFTRNVGRRLGANRLIAHSKLMSGAESNPDDEFLALIQAGDCVWDIGANVGTYTMAFADQAGPSGRIVAFEPSRENRQRLTAVTAGRETITIRDEALGAMAGTVRFVQGGASGVTSRIDYDGSEEKSYDVTVARADTLLGELPAPNVIKIDVEGAEGDVLEGIGDMLRRADLRVVYVEVHFGILERRGRVGDARAIEDSLNRSGFAARWSDASHILAQRRAA